MHVLSLVVGVVFCRCFVGSTASDTSGFASQAWYVASLSHGFVSVCISAFVGLECLAITNGGENGPKRSKAEVQCYKCKGFGHYANKCPDAAISS